MASGIGVLPNPNKLANTFRSEKKYAISYDTIKDYIDCLCDSFLVEKSTRYDIKGKRYINSPYKYYFIALGLRNACINFRQYEKSHLMENLIYNERRVRGFNIIENTKCLLVKMGLLFVCTPNILLCQSSRSLYTTFLMLCQHTYQNIGFETIDGDT